MAPPRTFCTLVPMAPPRGLLSWTPHQCRTPRTMEPCKTPRAQVPTLEFWERASSCVCVFVHPSSSFPFSLTFLEVPGTQGKLQAGQQTSRAQAEAAVHRENFF